MDKSAAITVTEVMTGICTRIPVEITLERCFVNIPCFEKISQPTLTTMRQWTFCRNRQINNRKTFGTCIELFDSPFSVPSVNNGYHFTNLPQVAIFAAFCVNCNGNVSFVMAGNPKCCYLSRARNLVMLEHKASYL